MLFASGYPHRGRACVLARVDMVAAASYPATQCHARIAAVAAVRPEVAVTAHAVKRSKLRHALAAAAMCPAKRREEILLDVPIEWVLHVGEELPHVEEVLIVVAVHGDLDDAPPVAPWGRDVHQGSYAILNGPRSPKG